MTLKAAESCLFEEAQQFFLAVRVTGGSDTADIERNVHSRSEFWPNHVLEEDLFNLPVFADLFNVGFRVVYELIEALGLQVGLFFVVLDATHLHHVLTDQLRDPQGQHGGRINEIIGALSLFGPVHHERHWNLGPRLDLVHPLHYFIFDDYEGQS